jgi:type II secretory pathway pseudopilin PulG
MKNSKGGIFTILEILIVLVIISFLFTKFSKIYFGSPVANKEINRQLQEQGIDTSNARAVIDSTKSKVEAINQEAIKHQQEMEEQLR